MAPLGTATRGGGAAGHGAEEAMTPHGHGAEEAMTPHGAEEAMTPLGKEEAMTPPGAPGARGVEARGVEREAVSPMARPRARGRGDATQSARRQTSR